MSLTYQPFANTPAVEALGKDLKKNVHSGERLACILAAGSAFVQARRTSGWRKLVLYASSLGLLYRGATGHCKGYELAGINTRR